MIPWVVVAVVAVPLVVIAFVASRRRTASPERPPADERRVEEETERAFADAEAYEAEWHEKDKERFRHERLP